jgi:hypothetical protein
MIQTVLVYDGEDVALGGFFRLCADKYRYLHRTCSNQSDIIEHTSGSSRNEIELSVSKYNDNNFLFISYLHGNENAMTLSNETIVSIDNAHLFTNAFCYTFSCCCGKNLSSILLDNRALVFWGYADEAYSFLDYEEDFAELAISGLKHFFANETVECAYNKTKEEYIKKIDSLYQENLVVAAYLLHNKDAMVVYGNKSITVSDFIIKDK